MQAPAPAAIPPARHQRCDDAGAAGSGDVNADVARMERPAFARCASYGTGLSPPKRGARRRKRNPGSPYLLDAVVPIRKSLQILHVCASGAAHFPRRDFVRRLIAYVLLDADRPLDPAAVIAALRQRHPNQPVEPMTGAAPPTGRAIEAATMMLRCA